MGLLSFFKREFFKRDGAAPSGKSTPVADAADSVQQARTRARQRLIGAVVLVGAGVIGFPLLFESQPRPLPGDLPIEIARSGAQSGAASSAPSTPRPAPATAAPKPAAAPPSVITESAADAGREVVAPSVAAASRPAPAVVAVAPERPAPPPVKPEAKPEPKPADSGRAQALLEGKRNDPKPAAAAADGRFIVQVGAYAEVTAAREARQKVEKLGLKTYTQVVETASGKRIRVRVGPFASRGDADKAADRIKATGLTSAVYTL